MSHLQLQQPNASNDSLAAAKAQEEAKKLEETQKKAKEENDSLLSLHMSRLEWQLNAWQHDQPGAAEPVISIDDNTLQECLRSPFFSKRASALQQRYFQVKQQKQQRQLQQQQQQQQPFQQPSLMHQSRYATIPALAVTQPSPGPAQSSQVSSLYNSRHAASLAPSQTTPAYSSMGASRYATPNYSPALTSPAPASSSYAASSTYSAAPTRNQQSLRPEHVLRPEQDILPHPKVYPRPDRPLELCTKYPPLWNDRYTRNNLHTRVALYGAYPDEDQCLCYKTYIGSGCPYQNEPNMCRNNHSFQQSALNWLVTHRRLLPTAANKIVETFNRNRPVDSTVQRLVPPPAPITEANPPVKTQAEYDQRFPQRLQNQRPRRPDQPQPPLPLQQPNPPAQALQNKPLASTAQQTLTPDQWTQTVAANDQKLVEQAKARRKEEEDGIRTIINPAINETYKDNHGNLQSTYHAPQFTLATNENSPAAQYFNRPPPELPSNTKPLPGVRTPSNQVGDADDLMED
jgi:hypothetical protein